MTKYRVRVQYQPEALVRIERKQGWRWHWVNSCTPEDAEMSLNEIIRCDSIAEIESQRLQAIIKSAPTKSNRKD